MGIAADARSWYRANWDPDLSVGAWFRTMYEGGWGYPTWPERWGGKGLSISDAKLVRAARQEIGALGPPSGIGPSLLAPMLFRHGSEEQCERFLSGMAYENWTVCQMLSEPDAGSDLAASRTSAVHDGDEWHITGTKVWTSNAHIVTFGMLLARSDWDAPKHRGLSFFICPAQQPAVEVRPIRQMNGLAEFNLVHFDDAVVPGANLLGDVGDGWAVAKTFLTYEKNSYNPSAHEGGPFNPVDLHARAGDLAETVPSNRSQTIRRNRGVRRRLEQIVEHHGGSADPTVRQELARLYTMRQIMGYTNLRMRTAGAPGLEGPISKLTVSELTRMQRDLGLRVQGAAGMLVGDDSAFPDFQDFVLSSPATSIGGGTDQIQRNHLAERVLGLPREPSADADRPFREISHGAQEWQ